jgi:NADH-quinone oxidoreductase subunit L
VTVPLVALAIPSILIGALTVGPVLFGHYFTGSILVLDRNDVLGALGEEFGGPVLFALQGLLAPPFWLAAGGAVTAWAFFLRRPAWAELAARKARWLYRVLTEKYYFDWFNERILAPLARLIGVGLWKGGDEALIDGALVNGSAATVGWLGSVMRRVQSGYLYSYAFWMMIGLALLLGWFLAHARF